MRDTSIDWPDRFERTSPEDREYGSKFSATLGASTRQLETELDRVGVDNFHASIGNAHTRGNSLPMANANPDDPGFVLRWTDDGQDYAVACDHYSDLRSNVRAVYLWLKETRMRDNRPVKTSRGSFAAAALPSGDDDGNVVLDEPPHQVLSVDVNASEAVVKAAARARKKDAHPDNGGSVAELKRVTAAEEALLDE